MSIWGYANSLYNSACSGFAHIVGIMEEGGFAHVMGLIEEGVLAEPIVQYPPQQLAIKELLEDTDLFATIFGYLPHEKIKKIVQAMGNKRVGGRLSVSAALDQGRCHLSLQTIFPTLSIIDQGVWERCFGKEALERHNLDFSGAPQLTNEEIDELGRLQTTLPIEDDAGGAYMIMPKNVTRKALIALAMSRGVVCDSGWSPVLAEKNDQPVEKTYGVYISKSVLKGTRNMTLLEKRVVVEDYKCSLPNVIDAIAFVVFTCISSISSSEDSSLTRHHLVSTPAVVYRYCAESCDGYPMVVGHPVPASAGFCFGTTDVFPYGACAIRKFEAIDP